MILACFCGGIIELGLLLMSLGGACLASTSITYLYNAWRCKIHNCKHNCGKK